jgi:predicted amidohydrolase
MNAGGYMKEKFKIALAQISCKPGDKRGNLDRIRQVAEKAADCGAELVVLPEMSLTGYVIRDQIYGLAEGIPGPSVSLVEKISNETGIHIIFGMPALSQKARATIHNTAVLVSPKGLVGKYHKMYLPTHSMFEDKRYFRPGYEAGVFDTDLGKIGLVICYDIYFPEVIRLARLEGAQLIVCISASPAVRQSFFEILTAARAIENTVFLAFVNLVGIEDGLQFWGGSRLVGPNGRVLVQAKYDEDDFVTGEVDYSDIRSIESFVPAMKDLRPELFDKLRKNAEQL